MSNLVIVAIPAQDDYIWQISSEKVPHLTLCFLGDAADIDPTEYEKIVDFTEHAATTLNPFYMDVDYRGTLGPDEADVLFFEKGWDYKAVSRFRDQLLQNHAIKAAYNSIEQFPDWTPHITLGYPATPAKTPDRPDRTIYSVHFDRIAVWTGNFDGPEFRLKRECVGDSVGSDWPYVSMSAKDAKTLLHYGVKGMRWGQRRTDPATKATPGGIKAQVKKLHESRDKSRGPATTVAVKPGISKKTGKAEVQTTGGERQPPHPDAIKAKTTSQQLHLSGITSLSNKELQDLANRLDLEQRVNRLDPPKLSAGQKIVQNALSKPHKRQEYEKNVKEGAELVKKLSALQKTKRAVKVAAAVAV